MIITLIDAIDDEADQLAHEDSLETLLVVSVLQIATYLALEVAMLTQSLASESLRLLDESELPHDD